MTFTTIDLDRNLIDIRAGSSQIETMSKSVCKELPVWSDPERLGGAVCFAGTRVPVDTLFQNLEDGVSLDEFLTAFEGVSRNDALAVIERSNNRQVAHKRPEA